MLHVPYTPFQMDELVMCGNFDRPHLVKRASHERENDAFIRQRVAYNGDLQELNKFSNEFKPNPEWQPLLAAKQEVEAAFDLLKALTPPRDAALDNPSLLPPPPSSGCSLGRHAPLHSICHVSRWCLQHAVSPHSFLAAKL